MPAARTGGFQEKLILPGLPPFTNGSASPV
jgi:hypothetical protein